ncbi:Abi family protein [Lapidilactobacillus bayanensis]|uniref:Abi family protein n=1 Tax=Lapidilactobacillus bayanensis TaxID=2485998 RepID=UPI000F773848|nr:Abi family protein [Lapidilactobacillus bayanensis]
MNQPPQLTFEEQREKLEKLGIVFNQQEEARDIRTIETIGYYKLKEFAMPFNRPVAGSTEKIHFENLTFKALIARYYQDKNLRINILHAIEDIEVFLRNEVAKLLGEKYGAFGYLRFANWCDRTQPKFTIEEQQYRFKKNLLKKVKKSNMPDIRYSDNLNNDNFPTVWLMIDALTFGDIVSLLKILSKGNLRIISKKFDCTAEELLSWCGCLNLVRNICCHNADLLDIKFTTAPKIPTAYANNLVHTGNDYTRGIAVAVFIVMKLMQNVNPKYDFGDVQASLKSIVNRNQNLAIDLGFIDLDALNKIPSVRHKKFKARKKHRHSSQKAS